MDDIALAHTHEFSNVRRTTFGQPREAEENSCQSLLINKAPVPMLQTRIKPAVPPKKNSLATAASRVDPQAEVYRLTGQIAQLKKEVHNSQTRAEDTQNALDKVLVDLISTHADLDVQLQTKASLEASLSDLRQNFSKLEVELQSKSKQLSTISTAPSNKERQLEEELERTNQKLKEQAEEIEGLKEAADKKAQEESLKEEKYCQEIKQLKSSHAALSREHAEELEQLRSERLAELDAENATKFAAEIEQLKATHTAEHTELRRVTSFFKSNSEQLSKEILDLRDANRALEEALNSSMDDRNRELQGAIEALQNMLVSKDREVEELKGREQDLLSTVSKLKDEKSQE
ncbi:hypothetical protein F5884DRAFT_858313 [Xylogone sp. PMI_703]|nr:hypothetical protein F5884DRAFT_858313 [Xylogone sp. PMI_703]